MEDKRVIDKDLNRDLNTPKGVPPRDGRGMGVRKTRGRGGCDPPEDRNKKARLF